MAGYEPVGWKNYPDKTTSISAENLNHMDEGIKKLDTEKLNIDKITQSTAVNQDGYALDAREKNASISGTMANQINELNTNLTKKSVKFKTISISHSKSDYANVDFKSLIPDMTFLINAIAVRGKMTGGDAFAYITFLEQISNTRFLVHYSANSVTGGKVYVCYV